MTTDANWETFLNTLSRNPQKVTKIMYIYLVEGLKQEDAMMRVYGHFDYNYASIILQCYNFSGKNSGKFSGTKLGGVVKEEDIAEFVRMYPNGVDGSFSVSPGNGIELENFLREKIAKRNNSKNNNKNFTKSSTQNYNQTIHQNYDDNFFNENQDTFNDFKNNKNTIQSVYNNQQYSSFDNPKDSNKRKVNFDFSYVDAKDIVIGFLSFGSFLIILALLFDWFNIRTKIISFLIIALQYGWIIGMGIFAIMLILDKIEATEDKGFFAKLFTLILIGIVSAIIVCIIIELLGKAI